MMQHWNRNASFQRCRNYMWERNKIGGWTFVKWRRSHPYGNIAERWRLHTWSRNAAAACDPRYHVGRGWKRRETNRPSRGERGVRGILRGGGCWDFSYTLRPPPNVWRFQRAHKRHSLPVLYFSIQNYPQFHL